MKPVPCISLLFVAIFATTSPFFIVSVVSHDMCKLKQVMNTTSHYEVHNCTIENNIVDVEFSFRPFSIIEHIYFNRSRIQIVPQNFFATFELLRTCNLTRVGLEAMHRGTFKHAKILAVLDLMGNKVKKLENFLFDGTKSMEVLNLTQNEVEVVERNAFSGLTVLKQLILSQNKISVLESNLLDDMGELIKLNLSGNRISVIPQGFFDLNANLKVLDLSSNSLKLFNVYIPVSQLCYLGLDGNKVDELILHLNDTMSENECDTVHRGGGGGATSTSPIIVTANGNNIRKLALPKFLNVDVLSLNGNQISDVQNVTHLKNLRQLTLSNNPINIDAVQSIVIHLQQLRYLSLSGISINQLDFHIFANLSHLIELDVANNSLPELDLTDVNSLHELTKLNISNNRLMHIDFDYLRYHFPQLKILDINRNEFGCDILKEMLHVSFKRQRIKATPRSDQLQIKNKPNVDGISCLQELNIGHLEVFEGKLKHYFTVPLEQSVNSVKLDLTNEITKVKTETMTHVEQSIRRLEKRFEALENRFSYLFNQNEQIMLKLIKLLDGE